MDFKRGFRLSAVVVGGVMLSGVVLSIATAVRSDVSSVYEDETSGREYKDMSTVIPYSDVTVADPKDARAEYVCHLVPEEVAARFGLELEGRKLSDGFTPEDPDSCSRRSQDHDGTKNVIVVSDEHSIEQYYGRPTEYDNPAKLKIAGYHAVRINQLDPMKWGRCNILMATQENQTVESYTRVSPDDIGEVDPCELSKKVLRLSVSSWPAAK
ncbi:hypothetical protein FHR84_004191 [Actinopolyspora biskrensis]|uniref:DUF3558 domain-containing protein n=1 Tax=Actinopolyspora biskrensis TaxID=1470178 RepID=A0A852ZFP4_9ACTN|nr:hypothetical protein [Actinopolyspora biskrensis]NYH80823.1 hypothetical protein [Actinopolyspora biskrensis]